jgi:hypothetical protein
MKKQIGVFLFLLSSAVSMFAAGSTSAAAPVCLFTDVVSGPAAGGEGGNGIYLTIFGKNFGSTRGTSTVTINGEPAAQYLMWTQNYNSTAQDAIGVQIGSGTTGTGPIVVTTPEGSCSNLSFTVRPGKIYFIGPNADNSKPASCSAMLAANSYSSPWGLTNYASTIEKNYSYTMMRTPYTYYNCIGVGDTLVFLNGVSYPYYDGYGWNASITMTKTGSTAANYTTIMARPGAAVQLGGEGWAPQGLRNTGTSSHNVYSGITFIGGGSGSGYAAIQVGNYDRLVGSTIKCPSCSGEIGALDGMYPYSNNLEILGNSITSVATDTSVLPNGSNKEFHAIYVGGNNVEIAWNRIYNTQAYNGIQINHDGSTGFYNQSYHDNDIADVNGSGITLGTIDPSSGFIQVYNNVIHHVGVNDASDGDADDPHNCISVKGYYGSPEAGTVQIYNNTMYDCSSNLNIHPLNSGSCAVLNRANTWNSVTTKLVNNTVYQPAYVGTKSVNVYLCGYPKALLTGSDNIWYSASTPGSTQYATSVGKIENPLYVSATEGPWSNYQLQSGSPALGAGTPVSSVYGSIGSDFATLTWDFNGSLRPSPPSIGAFENGSASSSQPITASASPNPATSNEPITLTATVAQSGNKVPTGTVEFLNGTDSLGQAALNSQGIATLVIQPLPAGSYQVAATYAGNSSYAAEQSSSISLEVQSDTTTGLSASSDQVAVGQTLTLTATVEGSGNAVPEGSVNFLNGSSQLGTATLSSSGAAKLSTSALAAGKYSLTAQYPGNASSLASTSSPVSVTVTSASQATTTTLVANPNPLTVGAVLTLTATVKGTGSAMPTGTVSFMNGSTIIGTGTLTPAGVATLSTSNLAAGTFSLTAQYAASGSFLSSTSSAVSVSVKSNSPSATTTSLTASANQILPVQVLTLWATVKGNGKTIPSGTVTFTSGSTLIGTVTLNYSGVAQLSTTTLANATYQVTAKYAGNSSFAASSSSVVSITVKPQTTMTSLTAAPNPIAVGQTLTLTATVKGTTIIPGGVVNFMSGSKSLGTANVSSTGVATLAIKSLAAGSCSLTAVYEGNSISVTSNSPAVSVTVTAQAAVASLSATPTPVTFGQALKLTATVKGNGKVAPAGTVLFMDGSTQLGTATLNSSSVATFSTAALAAGSYDLTAVYAGNSIYLSDQSAKVAVTVSPASTTAGLTVSSSSITLGQAMVLTATVKTSGTTKPTGTVSFLNGSTILGTAALNASGVATLSTSSLAVGKYGLFAQYEGNKNLLISSSTKVSVTVNAQATKTSLTASAGKLSAGQKLTLSASVKGGGPVVPAGTVSFFNGTALLGTAALNNAGVATLNASSLAAGTHSLTSQYAGNGSSSASTSARVTVTVTPSDSSTAGSLTNSPSMGAWRQSLTTTAIVNEAGAAKPEGSVDAEAVTIVHGSLVRATETDQSQVRHTVGTALCTISVPTSGSQAGAKITYLGESGSCRQPASR